MVEENERTEWLKNLKQGDTVLLQIKPRRLATVERTTATQVIVCGMRFNKVNGHLIGNFGFWIEEPTPYWLGKL